MTTYVIVWIVASLAVGIFAGGRGRGSGTWFVISLLLSPLLGFLLCAASKDLKAEAEKPSDLTHVRCPACAEWVRPEASVCKHCGAARTPDHGYAARQKEAVMHANAKKAVIGFGIILAIMLAIFLKS